jgi:hypothetical protein
MTLPQRRPDDDVGAVILASRCCGMLGLLASLYAVTLPLCCIVELSPRRSERIRSSAARLPLLPGRMSAARTLVVRWWMPAKYGIVASDVTVVVVAALLFLLTGSLPGMGRCEVLSDRVSEDRRS